MGRHDVAKGDEDENAPADAGDSDAIKRKMMACWSDDGMMALGCFGFVAAALGFCL